MPPLQYDAMSEMVKLFPRKLGPKRQKPKPCGSVRGETLELPNLNIMDEGLDEGVDDQQDTFSCWKELGSLGLNSASVGNL